MKNYFKNIRGNIYNWYKNERKILALSLISGILITVVAALYTKNYSEKIISGISSQVIRFHVLANSDSPNDQALKLMVKDRVLEEYSPMLNASSSIGETRRLIEANLTGIEELAQEIIKAQGYDYRVKASLGPSNFPTKQYGDITLPAGGYEALRVEIGEGKGQNWWCVMFPPLCYVDIAKSEIDPATKESLQNILTDEEYMLMDNNIRQNDDMVKIKFKIVEWWQERGGKIETDDRIIAGNYKPEAIDGSF